MSEGGENDLRAIQLGVGINELRLGNNHTKEEVITFYLNNFEFEEGIYGFPMASYYYFNKPVNNLTDEEILELVLNMYNSQ